MTAREPPRRATTRMQPAKRTMKLSHAALQASGLLAPSPVSNGLPPDLALADPRKSNTLCHT